MGIFDSLVQQRNGTAQSADRLIARKLVDVLSTEAEHDGFKPLVEQLRARSPQFEFSVDDIKQIGEQNHWFDAGWAERVAGNAGLRSTDEVFQRVARQLPQLLHWFTPRGEIPSDRVVQHGLESMRRQLGLL